MSDAIVTSPQDELRNSTRNAPPKLSNGIKIAALCTTMITAGLLIPMVYARRKSSVLSAAAIIKPTIALHSSPSYLLRARPAYIVPTSLQLSYIPPRLQNPYSVFDDEEPPVAPSLGNVKSALAALSIATGIVTAVAGTVVFSFKWVTGISTVPEFATFMRNKIADTVPSRYNSRLHAPDPTTSISSIVLESMDPVWKDSLAPDAVEYRLQRAFDEGGLAKWGEQAFVELEREWKEGNQK